MSLKPVQTVNGKIIQDPPLAKFLFSDTRFGIVWLVVRVLLGWEWLQAGLHKLEDPRWMETGEALQGYWTRAVAIPETGRPAITYSWYRDFLQGLLDSGSYVWFAKLVAIGEFLVGLGLIVGLFVGIAAFFGVLMNWNFIMAGSASSNGFLMIVGILLILAWKTAGYYGLDRYALPYLGTPWKAREPRDTNDTELKVAYK